MPISTAPTVNINDAAKMVFFLPYFVFIVPPMREVKNADKTVELTTTSCCISERFKVLEMGGIAPEITPVGPLG
jgi:hypothetical protein